jgi:hypothetical protein
MNDREAFEKWISGPPYERSIDRYPNDPTRYGFPGTYREHDVDLCWLAWQEALARQQAELDASEMRSELYKAAGELLAKETNELEDRLAYLDRLVEAVEDCCTRMERARGILRKNGNWGVLDTTEPRKILAAAIKAKAADYQKPINPDHVDRKAAAIKAKEQQDAE